MEIAEERDLSELKKLSSSNEAVPLADCAAAHIRGQASTRECCLNSFGNGAQQVWWYWWKQHYTLLSCEQAQLCHLGDQASEGSLGAHAGFPQDERLVLCEQIRSDWTLLF
ncbi:hypothetical protein Trydic_g22489 [Trypoxylus dichotomus]